MKKGRGAFRKFSESASVCSCNTFIVPQKPDGLIIIGLRWKAARRYHRSLRRAEAFFTAGGDRRSFRVGFEKTWRFDIFGAMECNRDDEKASLEKAARTAGFCVAALRSVPFRRPVRRGTFQPGPRGLFSAAKGGACGARGTLGSRGFYGRKSRRCSRT